MNTTTNCKTLAEIHNAKNPPEFTEEKFIETVNKLDFSKREKSMILKKPYIREFCRRTNNALQELWQQSPDDCISCIEDLRLEIQEVKDSINLAVCRQALIQELGTYGVTVPAYMDWSHFIEQMSILVESIISIYSCYLGK